MTSRQSILTTKELKLNPFKSPSKPSLKVENLNIEKLHFNMKFLDLKFGLDAGHGVDTPGKRSPIWKDGTQLFEWEFNRNIVTMIADELTKLNINHKIIVPENKDISLSTRVKRINEYNPDLLISIHGNAGGGTGFEVWTSVGKTKSDEYADMMARIFMKQFPEWKTRVDTSDGDLDKEKDFYIIKKTKCPAILTENLFMDTEKDCRFMMSKEGRLRIANAHVDLIKAIVGLE